MVNLTFPGNLNSLFRVKKSCIVYNKPHLNNNIRKFQDWLICNVFLTNHYRFWCVYDLVPVKSFEPMVTNRFTNPGSFTTDRSKEMVLCVFLFVFVLFLFLFSFFCGAL